MTFVNEVAKRYASALFEAVGEKSQHAQVLEELRAVEKILQSDDDFGRFFSSPLVKPEEKVAVVKAALEKGGVTDGVKNLALVLAARDRVEDWAAVVQAYQARSDEAHGVVRGIVRSASALLPDQRTAIEKKVAQVTGKQVVLEYKQDEALLGGLVAEVGSYTFDDSLETQLRLMNESLKRSAH